jgi:hypothetical protein
VLPERKHSNLPPSRDSVEGEVVPGGSWGGVLHDNFTESLYFGYRSISLSRCGDYVFCVAELGQMICIA